MSADNHGTGTVSALLARTARQAPGWLALLFLASAASIGTALLAPAVLAATVDSLLGHTDATAKLTLLAALLGVGVLAAAGTEIAEGYCTAAATCWLRHRLVGHLLALGVTGPRRFAAGDLASRAVGVAPQLGRAAPLLVQSAMNLVLSLGALALLWSIDWRLVVTLALVAPVGLALLAMFARDASLLVGRYQESQSLISTRLVDALVGIRTIRAAGTVERETERVLAPLPELAEAGQSLWRGYGGLAWRTALVGPLTTVAVLAIAGQGLVTGRTSSGQFLAAAGYAPMALGLLNQVPQLLSFVRLRVSARRLVEVFSVPAPRVGTRVLPPGPGELRMQGVTVRAQDAVLLDDLDLVVPAGQTVAVVGRFGAGKTTLAEVAGRLVDPDEGQVLLDGVALDEVAPASLRREVAYAFERPALLGTTVADSIGYGCEDAAPQLIEQAAAVAQAGGFIKRLPAGFRTPLPGLPLSGGEAQRLGLARAFVRRSRLLVLDDATSSLDSVTEAQLSAALTGTSGGQTRIIVAHRVNTAARADLVAWLEDGRVRLLAPHRHLWRDPAYRALFETPLDQR
ncbi:MAG: ATP-binding cassette, subfamily bacterial RamA/AmfB [Pseudonocardiales bacterium]|jgi:ATP-binding cassette subfamily B protein|nr:ATP-binding cassette, subfamily bacterial RamA/AmfB [Pseudonocardiales bacterium]